MLQNRLNLFHVHAHINFLRHFRIMLQLFFNILNGNNLLLNFFIMINQVVMRDSVDPDSKITFVIKVLIRLVGFQHYIGRQIFRQFPVTADPEKNVAEYFFKIRVIVAGESLSFLAHMYKDFLRASICTSSGHKCYRFFALFGSLFLVLIFAGCQNVDLQSSKSDFLHSDDILYYRAESRPITYKVPVTGLNYYYEDEGLGPDWVYGTLISADIAESIIQKIRNREKYLTVVILAATDHQTENSKIFTYSSKGILAEKGIQMDDPSINSLTNANIVENLGVVTEGSYWNKDFMGAFAKYFPNAKFVLISINRELTTPRGEILAYGLKSHLPENSIMLAITDFEVPDETKNPLITGFQEDFTQEILLTSDFSRFDELPTNSHVTNQVLGQYLIHKGAKKSQVFGNQAYFQEGTPQKETDTVYMVAFGDIMIGRYVRSLMDANGLDYPFAKMDESYLKVNDLLLANLEGPITTKAVRTNTGMNFGFFSDTAPILKKYYFDILSQANNHAFDKTKSAYEESFKYLKQQGIIPFGNPNEITDKSAAYLHIRGQKFAFLGLEEVNTKIDDEKAVEKIKELDKKGYKVIVYPHWGIEYKHAPSTRQKDLGHKFIDAGAYAVIGHHPHVVQTIENYKGHPIVYSLGNAVFDQYWSAPTQEGLSIAVKMSDKKIEISLLPIKLPNSQMQLMTQEETTKFTNRFISWGEYSEEEKTAIKNGKLTFYPQQ